MASRQLTGKDRLAILKETDPLAYEAALRRARKYRYQPTDAQLPVTRSRARYRLVRAGRRFGKTKTAAHELVHAARNKPGSMNWWVANTYKNVRRGYKEVLRQIPPSMLAKPAPPPTANDLIITIKAKGGGVSYLEFYSAGNPDAMAGEGVDFLVADEAALWPNGESVWNTTLRPTLADSGGRVLFISTPRGHNWFWKLDLRGQSADYPDYESWHYTMEDNPYIPASEIEDLRDVLPELVFQQEILAEYVSDAASIFKVPETALIPALQEPRGVIIMGVDLARKHDFTVITASRTEDRMPVYHERYKNRRWVDQREIILAAVTDLRALPDVEDVIVAVDATGGPSAGDVVVEDLEDAGINVTGQHFTNQWKTAAVKQLAADLERGRAFIPEEARDEFENYEYNLTPNGNYQFSAPEGMYDDQVAAKLLEHSIMHETDAGIGGIRVINPLAILEADDPDEGDDDGEIKDLKPDRAEEIMLRPGAWH